ncbi:hypothetical protein [Stetteria hydrogenophila]
MEFAEEGIPGHAAKSPWAHRLQSKLKELQVPFEAEGEATRIRLAEGVYAEVREAGGGRGYAVSVTVPLPVSGDDPESAAEAFKAAAGFITALGRDVKYEVDESLPGYPMLRAVVEFSDPKELADAVVKALKASEKASGR